MNQGASPRYREMKEFAISFYNRHKADAPSRFRSKERMALYLRDVELPRHFGAQGLPSWARIRVWLPKEGRLKDMRETPARRACRPAGRP